MSFSDKMRDSLGAEGARIEVSPPRSAVAPGGQGEATVTIVGGSRTARVDALIVKVVQADRHWVDASGAVIAEAEAPARDARKGLTAGWTRTPVTELRVAVERTVEPGERHDVKVQLAIPGECKSSSDACSHTLNVQADIKGQIDPTGNARMIVA